MPENYKDGANELSPNAKALHLAFTKSIADSPMLIQTRDAAVAAAKSSQEHFDMGKEHYEISKFTLESVQDATDIQYKTNLERRSEHKAKMAQGMIIGGAADMLRTAGSVLPTFDQARASTPSRAPPCAPPYCLCTRDRARARPPPRTPRSYARTTPAPSCTRHLCRRPPRVALARAHGSLSRPHRACAPQGEAPPAPIVLSKLSDAARGALKLTLDGSHGHLTTAIDEFTADLSMATLAKVRSAAADNFAVESAYVGGAHATDHERLLKLIDDKLGTLGENDTVGQPFAVFLVSEIVEHDARHDKCFNVLQVRRHPSSLLRTSSPRRRRRRAHRPPRRRPIALARAHGSLSRPHRACAPQKMPSDQAAKENKKIFNGNQPRAPVRTSARLLLRKE